MKFKLAIFDLDGTILDTLQDLCDSTNYVLCEFGMPERTLDEVRRFVGNGIRNLLIRAAAEGTKEETIDAMFAAFKEHYAAHCKDRTKPYEGICELLKSIRSQGMKTAVVSNKGDFAVQELVEEYFPGLFDYAVGERDGIRRKPAPDSVKEVMNYLMAEAKDTVYIGDSEVDYQTACNAGTDYILVTWGFREESYLREKGAARFAHTRQELEQFLLKENTMRKEVITRESTQVKKLGRIYYHDQIAYLAFSAAGVGFYFTGNQLAAELVTDENYNKKDLEGMVGVFVGADTEPWKRFLLTEKEGTYELFDRAEYAKAKGLALTELPKELAIRIVKFSEAAFGAVGIRALLVEDDAVLTPLPEKKIKMEVLGDSITCGYGNEGVWGENLFNTATENPFCTYATLTARALDADYQLVSWSGIGLISDYIPPEKDEPDETILYHQIYPYAAYAFCEREGYPQQEWDFTSYVPDYVVMYLGTNDDSYTRQLPEREAAFVRAYDRQYEFLRAKYPDAQLICCMGIMARTLCPVIADFVAKKQNAGDKKIHYLEFEGQKDEDGIGTDWHPSKKTHAIAADKLTEFIRSLE